jgi:regulator of protease activity HflC (stomatin/prohibitin superfamily)
MAFPDDFHTKTKGIFMNSFPIKQILFAVAAFLVLLLILGSFEVINPDERAVKVTLGEVSTQDYGPGVQFKAPILSHFETVSTQPIRNDVLIDVGAKGAVSSDNQTIGLEATVAWNYDVSRVHDLVTKYPNRSTLENLVNNTTYEALKAEIGRYTIFDLAKNAGKIAADAKSAATLKLKDYPVTISQVNLTNWDWSEDFDAQIKATMNTQQRVAQAKAEADRVEQQQRALAITAEAQAKAQIATAEGEKQSKVLAAEADKETAILRAEAKRAEGQGINDYNRLIAQNLDTELKFRQLEIDKIRAEKWDGRQVSQYVPLTAAGAIVTIPDRR